MLKTLLFQCFLDIMDQLIMTPNDIKATDVNALFVHITPN